MSNIQEKILFSERFKKALKQLKYPISPTYISKEFNRHYDGQPISVQSANNWLQGKAIPNQDKLVLLAKWLDVPIQWLRFGEENSNENLEISSIITNDDLVLLSKLNKLNNNKKMIITSLIDELICN